MTTAKELVTSLEVSKQLEEFGIPQGKTYFVWIKILSYEDELKVNDNEYNYCVEPRKIANMEVNENPQDYKILCDAFTFSEIKWLIRKPHDRCSFGLLYPNAWAHFLMVMITENKINPQDLKL